MSLKAKCMSVFALALTPLIAAQSNDAPPPTETINVELKTMPHRAFAGLRQNDAPQPVWTLGDIHPLGQPVISPDGHWLVITRRGDRYGELLVIVDLVNRKATEYKVPLPGVVGAAVFSRDGGELRGIVNTPQGYGFARWDFPAMKLKIIQLGPGVAFAAALTHKQDRAVVMREDGVACVFDVATGTKRFDVTIQQGKVDFYSAALAISPDDTVVNSGVIRPGNEWVRWSLTDGKRLASREVHEFLHWGRPVACNADGSALIVAAHFTMEMLSSATGERLAIYPGNGLNTLHNQPGVGLAAAPIGQGETFGIIDTQTGQLRMWAKHDVRPPAQHGYAGWAAISPDGKMAYSADYSSVKAWDLAGELERKPEWLFAGHPARALFKSPDGRRLIAVGETVENWDLETRRLLSSQPSAWLRQGRGGDLLPEWETGRNTRLIYAAGDRVRAVVMDEEGAQVYDLKDGKAILRLGAPRSETASSTANVEPGSGSHSSERQPTSVSFPKPSGYPGMAVSPDGTRLLVTTKSDLDVMHWSEIMHLAQILSVGFPVIPSESCFGSLTTLWNLETGRRLAVFANFSGPAKLVRFSTDGRMIVIVAENGSISVLRFDPNGDPVAEVVAPPTSRADRATAGANDVLMPSPDRLYVGTERGVLSTWDRIGGIWRKRFEHQITAANTSFKFPGVITRLAVSPSGRTLAAVIIDPMKEGTVLLLDTASGTVKAWLDDHVSDLCFLGEQSIATTSIRIWNLDTLFDKARH